MVIPRSRSRSMLSSICPSVTLMVLVYSSKRSARVLLPWSMWAMMQKFLICCISMRYCTYVWFVKWVTLYIYFLRPDRQGPTLGPIHALTKKASLSHIYHFAKIQLFACFTSQRTLFSHEAKKRSQAQATAFVHTPPRSIVRSFPV